MNALNSTDSLLPENMTRVLVSVNGTLGFMFYKDGMFENLERTRYCSPSEIDGWLPIRDLKNIIYSFPEMFERLCEVYDEGLDDKVLMEDIDKTLKRAKEK